LGYFHRRDVKPEYKRSIGTTLHYKAASSTQPPEHERFRTNDHSSMLPPLPHCHLACATQGELAVPASCFSSCMEIRYDLNADLRKSYTFLFQAFSQPRYGILSCFVLTYMPVSKKLICFCDAILMRCCISHRPHALGPTLR
jgi:hypothetical protein